MIFLVLTFLGFSRDLFSFDFSSFIFLSFFRSFVRSCAPSYLQIHVFIIYQLYTVFNTKVCFWGKVLDDDMIISSE